MFIVRLCSLFILGSMVAPAAEKTDWDFPLGPIGGRCFLQLGESSVRVSEVFPDQPGALADLQENDYLVGAFDTRFEKAIKDHWNFFVGPMKGLGEAIEKAQRGDGILPLMVLRSGEGIITLPIQLEANGGLGPAFPLGSIAFEEAYERSCAAIHESIINEEWRGKSGYNYPYRWAGLALLSHPNWNGTTGEKPYRLSIDQVRDKCLSHLANAQYAPVEQYLLDHTANPNFVNQFAGHENWVLNTSFLFLAEYLQKTKDEQYYDEFQTAAEKLANRVQWWADRYGRRTPGGGAHAGVHSDYNNCGFNICTSHSLSALAAAMHVTDVNGDPVLDYSVRPRDGRHFGYAEGIEKPANALPEIPAGWDPDIDPTIEDKMAWQWQQLKESMHSEYGAIHYWHGLSGPTFARDAFARNPGATFAYHTFLGDNPVPAAEQSYLDRMTDYSVRFNREHQYAHTHTITAITFTHMAMTYWSPQQRRHLLDNWKFYWHLSWNNNEAPDYFTTLFEHDGDSFYLLGEIFTALPYGIARGGLDLVPGWDTDDLVIDFHDTPHTWEVPEYRTLISDDGSLDLQLALVNQSSTLVVPDSVSWEVLSNNAAEVSITSPSQLNTLVTFAEDGLYTVKLTATAASRSVSETMRVHVHTRTAPAGYQLGSAFYQAYADKAGGETVISTSGVGDWEKSVPQLDFPPISENMITKVTGFIIPRETGNHRFYIASRNDGQFYLDTNGDGEVEEIAVCTDEPDDYDWTANPNQASALIPLTAGQAYPFEVLHKTDRFEPGPLAVGWTTPSNPEIEIIDSSVLAQTAPDLAAPTVMREPSEFEGTVGSYIPMLFYLESEETSLYQWYHNGVAVGPPTTRFTLSIYPSTAGAAGEFYCIATIGDHVLQSRTATVGFTDTNDIVEGSLWMDFHTETEGNDTDDLLDDQGFPWLVDGNGTLTSFTYTTSVSNSNHLGHRVTGWLVPEESGNYRLIATGDDHVQIFFSPTEYEAHKELVAETTGATEHQHWSEGRAGKSDYFALESGKRYFIEMLHKENRGDSYFAVTWQKEGDPIPDNDGGELPSTVLQHRHGGHFGDPGPVPPYYPDEIYLANFLDDATYQDPDLGGRFGDASGNGLANAFYYLFDLGDPTQLNLPKLQLTPTPTAGLPHLSEMSETGFTYSFVLPRSLQSLTVTPLASSDLLEWIDFNHPDAPLQPTSSSVEIIDDNYEIHTYSFPQSPGPLYFRISATSP